MNMKFLKLPEPVKQTLTTAGYTAGGMLLNRYIAPRILELLQGRGSDSGKRPLDANVQLAIRALSGLLLGSLGMQLIKKRDVSTALAVGALADVMVAVWNTYAPANMKFSGANMGLIIPMMDTPLQQLPPGGPFAGAGMGYQVTQEIVDTPYLY
jgi:hypothetical protein